MNPQPDRARRHRLADAMWWAPGLLVALGAAVATAHGLYEVVSAAGVPALVAAVYPLITDGLAVVAYTATMRLTGGGRVYAWFVVVLAAGLSGIAQAVYLAGGVASPRTGTTAHAVTAVVPAVLRFGVGAWPAVAAALAAHLLFMLGADARAHRDADHPSAAALSVHRPAPSTVVQPAALSSVQPDGPVNTPPRPTPPPAVQPVQRRALPARPSSEQRPASSPGSPAADRARAAARLHHDRTGQWPTVSQLQAATGVARGTAGAALKDLRDQPAALHVVHDTDTARTQP